MKTRTFLCTSFALAMACCSTSSLLAQDATELTGKEILAKHVEAVGGADRLKQTKSTVTEGHFEMVEAGIKAPLKITFAEPQKALFEIEFPGMGTILKGTDGDITWEENAMSGPRIIEGVEREQFLREADPLADLTPDKYFKSIENLGIKKIADRDCYEVKFTSKSDNIETRYYDAESFLLAQVEQVQETPMGQVNVTSTPSDYRDVDGMKVPFEVEISMMNQKQSLRFESVKFNADVPEGTFDLPESIKELQTAAAEVPAE